MRYSELVESGASEAQRQDFLSGGNPTPVTLRVPANLKDAVAEAAHHRGVSFSAFVRMCLIHELSR